MQLGNGYISQPGVQPGMQPGVQPGELGRDGMCSWAMVGRVLGECCLYMRPPAPLDSVAHHFRCPTGLMCLLLIRLLGHNTFGP